VTGADKPSRRSALSSALMPGSTKGCGGGRGGRERERRTGAVSERRTPGPPPARHRKGERPPRLDHLDDGRSKPQRHLSLGGPKEGSSAQGKSPRVARRAQLRPHRRSARHLPHPQHRPMPHPRPPSSSEDARADTAAAPLTSSTTSARTTPRSGHRGPIPHLSALAQATAGTPSGASAAASGRAHALARARARARGGPSAAHFLDVQATACGAAHSAVARASASAGEAAGNARAEEVSARAEAAGSAPSRGAASASGGGRAASRIGDRARVSVEVEEGEPHEEEVGEGESRAGRAGGRASASDGGRVPGRVDGEVRASVDDEEEERDRRGGKAARASA